MTFFSWEDTMIIGEGKKEISSICQAVKVVIDEMPNGKEFSGKELKKLVVKILPNVRYSYEETFLRSARKMCRDSFICIKRSKSLYKKVSK